MNFLKINKIIIILCLVFLSSTSFAYASLADTDIVVDIKPKFPRAKQTVSLNIESFVIDLDKTEINWYKNGVLQKSGLGEKSLSFQTRDLGSVDNILIEVGTKSLNVVRKKVTIRPAEVDLIWEADSFTPPFYKGKALNSYQSDIRVIAMPSLITENGVKINSKKLIYKWRKDWTVLGSKSGIGKNVLVLSGLKRLRDNIIVVDVKSLDGSINAQRTITVKSYKPKVVFYKKDALLGTMFNEALYHKFNLNEEEVSIVATPFFFSEKDLFNNSLKYNWTMNGKKIENNFNTIVLRQENQKEQQESISNLGLEIKNNNRIMQSIKEKIEIIFGIKKNNLFE